MRDIDCLFDLDPWGRDADEVESVRQRIYWMLEELPGSHVLSPEWGVGARTYIGAPAGAEDLLRERIRSQLETDPDVERFEVEVSELGESTEVSFLVRAWIRGTEIEVNNG